MCLNPNFWKNYDALLDDILCLNIIFTGIITSGYFEKNVLESYEYFFCK